MVRASVFIVSKSIGGNSETPPLAANGAGVANPGAKAAAPHWLVTRRPRGRLRGGRDRRSRDLAGLLLPCLGRFQDLQRLIRRAAKRHCVAAVAENLGIREIGGHRQTQIVHSRYAEADNPADKVKFCRYWVGRCQSGP